MYLSHSKNTLADFLLCSLSTIKAKILCFSTVPSPSALRLKCDTSDDFLIKKVTSVTMYLWIFSLWGSYLFLNHWPRLGLPYENITVSVYFCIMYCDKKKHPQITCCNPCTVTLANQFSWLAATPKPSEKQDSFHYQVEKRAVAVEIKLIYCTKWCFMSSHWQAEKNDWGVTHPSTLLESKTHPTLWHKQMGFGSNVDSCSSPCCVGVRPLRGATGSCSVTQTTVTKKLSRDASTTVAAVKKKGLNKNNR